MSIKQVEDILGIDRETIRFYIAKKLISPEQNSKGYRIYSEEDVRQLKRILILRQLEVSISDIREILCGKKDLVSVLKSRSSVLKRKKEYVSDAIMICDELIENGDSKFDPEPFFRNYSRIK